MGTEKCADYYNDVYGKDHKYAGNYKNLPHFPVFQIALSYIKELRNPYILELGCGTGQFAEMLWNNWFRAYTGVDFSEKAVELARKASPQAFEVQDLTTYSQPSLFDAVVCLETLEHIEKDLEIVERVWRGTNFIFSVPRFDDPSHVRHFNSKEEVEERYGKLIKIDDLLKYKNWYIGNGTRNGTYLTTTRR